MGYWVKGAQGNPIFELDRCDQWQEDNPEPFEIAAAPETPEPAEVRDIHCSYWYKRDVEEVLVINPSDHDPWSIYPAVEAWCGDEAGWILFDWTLQVIGFWPREGIYVIDELEDRGQWDYVPLETDITNTEPVHTEFWTNSSTGLVHLTDPVEIETYENWMSSWGYQGTSAGTWIGGTTEHDETTTTPGYVAVRDPFNNLLFEGTQTTEKHYESTKTEAVGLEGYAYFSVSGGLSYFYGYNIAAKATAEVSEETHEDAISGKVSINGNYVITYSTTESSLEASGTFEPGPPLKINCQPTWTVTSGSLEESYTNTVLLYIKLGKDRVFSEETSTHVYQFNLDTLEWVLIETVGHDIITTKLQNRNLDFYSNGGRSQTQDEVVLVWSSEENAPQ